MEIFSLTGLINGIIAIFLSLLVYSRNRNQVNRTFTFFILMVAFWSFAYWRWLSVTDLLRAFFWIKVFTIGSIFILPSFFHWVVSMIGEARKYRNDILLFYITSGIFTFALLFTNLMITGVEHRLYFAYWPIPGPLYVLFIAIFAITLTYSLRLIYSKIGAGLTEESKRYRLLFWGTIIGFVGGSTNFLLWYNIPLAPYGNFFVGIGALTWGYAAAKYSLFNSKVIATEFFAFILWIVFLIRLLLSNSWPEWILNFSILITTIIFGILLIKSVNQEIKNREKIEKLADELRVANQKLRELDKQKSEFLSFATHQLRSPLTAIKGYTSLILENTFGEIKNELREAVDRIFQSTEGMILMVEDFLNISRIEQGKMKYEMTDLNIATLAEEITNEMKPVALKKGLELNFIKNGSEYRVSGDPGKLRQVIANLIDNSIKYTPTGEVDVLLESVNEKIRVVIKDTGVGIPKSEIGHLFEKFSRAQNANKVNVTGTGLGLFLVKMITEAHGGKVWAESEGEGKGSRFIVEIPEL
jgi:signal transduction histidine kinase